MPGNMKCGRLRFSNCFVVFFPFLSSSPRSRFFVQLDPFLPFLSFHRSYTLQRISTCTIPWLSTVSLLFLLLLPIPIPPFLISSFLPCGILLPFVTFAISSWLLCLVFTHFSLDYSIHPRDSLIDLYRVSLLFNILIYEFLLSYGFFLKIIYFLYNVELYNLFFCS